MPSSRLREQQRVSRYQVSAALVVVETAPAISNELGWQWAQDCGPGTLHVPDHADGLSTADFQAQHSVAGGIFRPFERGNETWARRAVRTRYIVSGMSGDNLPILPGFREMAQRRHELLAELVAYRRAAGLSQSQVAERMGTSQPAVARLEAGDVDARMSTMQRYAAALGQQMELRLHPTGKPGKTGHPTETQE